MDKPSMDPEIFQDPIVRRVRHGLDQDPQLARG